MSLFETVQGFFAAEGWATEAVDPTTLRMSFRGDGATWPCFAHVRETHGQVTFYSVPPIKVPARFLPVMAELIARANFSMVVGNFELDFRDGEVRFRTSLELGPSGPDQLGGEPFARLFGRIVGVNLRMTARYLPAMLDVLGGRPPAEALADLDQATDGDGAGDD